MGKSRRSRGAPGHRRDPLAKPVKPPTDPELAALREAKILPIVAQLRDADPKSRSAAAAAVANIVQDGPCRKLLLREHLVHTVLTQTLTDAALESRAAGWGVLSLLAREEDADFALHLFCQDVLTAMRYAAKAMMNKLLSNDPSFSSLPKLEQKFVTSIVASLVLLLTALVEAGQQVFDAIVADPLLPQLLLFLVAHPPQGDDDAVANLRTDSLACLMVLCEDSASFAYSFASPQGSLCLQTLMALKDQVSADGILACSTLHNIFCSLGAAQEASPIPDADDSVLIPTLAKVLSATSSTPDATGWASTLEQQQLALETLASIATSLTETVAHDTAAPTQKKRRVEPVDGDEDMGDADAHGSGEEASVDGEGGDDAEEVNEEDDDEMAEDDIMADLELVTGADRHDGADADDLPVLKALLQIALPQLIRLAAPDLSSNNDDAAAHLRRFALAVLNNLAWSVSLFDFTDESNAGIQRAWQPIACSLWQKVVSPVLASDTADVGLAAQVTGLAWAVSRGVAGRVPLADGEHRKFIALYQATQDSAPQQGDAKGADGGGGDDDDPFKSLAVKCVGVLGQLALDPAPLDINREIGTFLVTLVAAIPATPPAAAVEALNQLLDVYADEAHACDAAVFWQDGFLAHLETALPKARAMVKAIDRKSRAELKMRADEAVGNLGRFLIYKRKHQP